MLHLLVACAGLNTWEINKNIPTDYTDEIIRVSNAKEAVDKALQGMVS
ncbi:MAG: hypothetical protein ABH870_04335 [bacterium]